jgi:hypothetical protein
MLRANTGYSADFVDTDFSMDNPAQQRGFFSGLIKRKTMGVKSRDLGKIEWECPRRALPPQPDTKPCKIPGGVID